MKLNVLASNLNRIEAYLDKQEAQLVEAAGYEDEGEDFSGDYPPTYRQYAQIINGSSVVELTKAMNKNHKPFKQLEYTLLFPSGFDMIFEGKSYPGKLAAALVKSKANESLSDLTNAFYSGRKLSPQAEKIFTQDVLKNPWKAIDPYENKEVDEFITNGFGEWAKHNPKIFKLMLMKLKPNQLDLLNKGIVSMDGEKSKVKKLFDQYVNSKK